MDITYKTYSADSVGTEVKNGDIYLRHRLQRPEGVWSSPQRSKLIDSLIRHYPINPIYVIVDPNSPRAAIDGIQRLGTIRDFYNDKFSLSNSINDVEINGINYKIAKKTFSELPPAVKIQLNKAQVQLCEIRDYTDEEVKELFDRINNGKPLNSIQKMTALMSSSMMDGISALVGSSFFEKVLTEKQFKDSTNLDVIIEALMMIENGKAFELTSFTSGQKKKFIRYYSKNVQLDRLDKISEALSRLDKHFEEKISVPKLVIPLTIYGMYRMIRDKKSFEKYFNWLDDFLANYKNNEEFLQYCNSGTTSAAKVQGRFQYFKSAMHDL